MKLADGDGTVHPTKVYLTGGDHRNLALDDDLRVTKAALHNVVNFVSNIRDADVVHSVSWEELLQIPDDLLLGKQIVSHISGEPFRYLKDPHFSLAMQKVGHWIAQSHQAEEQLAQMGLSVRQIPYAADSHLFYPLPPTDAKLIALRKEWNIPNNRYVIGNFHRDSEGHDLSLPKLMKGPDLFAEVVHLAYQRDKQVHVLLAGPRRQWMRKRLTELGVPYTYVGQLIDNRDDVDTNVLPQQTLNVLYNLLDLCVVSSRTEGGPRSVLEAMLAKCKIISTPVGLAPDVLDPLCIYQNVVEGVQLIADDIEDKRLDQTLEPHYMRALEKHRPESLAPLFRQLYAESASIGVYQGIQFHDVQAGSTAPLIHRRHANWKSYLKHQLKSSPLARRVWRRYMRPWVKRGISANDSRTTNTLSKSTLTVSLWHKFVPPPYGGGNQFMLALRETLLTHNVRVLENEIDRQIDAYVLNSVQFDIESFMALRAEQPLAILHRIDGPISLIRGRDFDQDELCFEINKKFAAVTVLQSYWTFLRTLELGFQPVHPVIIHNAADPTLFHTRGRAPFSPNRKMRLISSSWSDNPRKGGAIYKWLDQHLDWDRFEYTFVGRVSEQFDHIQLVKPVGSAELGEILRQHDIYITASQNDPCSNALIEALSCGLPSLYLNDGGHPELVGFGGLPFTDTQDILVQLDNLAKHYETFQNLIAAPRLDEVGRAYLSALQRAVEDTRTLISTER